MPGTRKVEHVRYQVRDRESVVDFYQNVLGLAEVDRRGGVVYMGCGFDQNYDLAVCEGSPGIEHFAFRVPDSEALERYDARLRDRGVETHRTDGTEPGQELGLRFDLPSDISMELVTVADKSYQHYYKTEVPGRGPVAPTDLNHYNFHSPIPERDTKFLTDILDFKATAVIDDWNSGAFLTRGDAHHDLAVLDHRDGPDSHASHHHTAFSVTSVEHMVYIIDEVVRNGGNLELGIGRHYSGNNLYAYFRPPDDHRIELVTQMTEVDENTPTLYVDSVDQAISAWEADVQPPDSWFGCSGLVH